MSGRRAKMFRQASAYSNIPEKQLKRMYRQLPKNRKLDFIKVEGRLITLSKDYLESLRLNIFPPPNHIKENHD